MTELMDAEDRLGISLPQTYVEAIEDFGLSDTDNWRLRKPVDLEWFADHPLSKTITLKHEALIVGEAQVGDDLLVMLGFEVAGIPALSDELYRLSDDGVDPEPVALDLLHLLEDGQALAMGRRETIFETAFEVRARAANVMDALTEALGGRGFESPPDDFDPRGEYLDVFVGESTPVLVAIRRGDLLWLGRRLSSLLGTSTNAFTVVLEDEMVEADDGEWEYPVRTRSVSITKSGEMLDNDSRFRGESANFGDPYETARAVMRELLGRDLGRGQVLEFYRPAPPEDLSARLVSLLGIMAEATNVSITEIAGQQAVRIELADGSVQMSVVSDEELAVLRERADVRG